MIKKRSIEDNAEFFSTAFGIVRETQDSEPLYGVYEKRTDNGKLVHMLMDSQNTKIQRHKNLNLWKR